MSDDLPQFGDTWMMWSMYPPGRSPRPKGWRKWWLWLRDRFRRSDGYDWPVTPTSSGRGILHREAIQAELDDFYNGVPPYTARPDPSEGWVWCSFTDPSLPEGERFLGVVVTTAAKWAMGLGMWI